MNVTLAQRLVGLARHAYGVAREPVTDWSATRLDLIATPAFSGFVASDDSATVALLSARAIATFTHNDWSLLLGVEPGVLLPPVNVGTGAESARLGRPWTMASVGLGRNF